MTCVSTWVYTRVENNHNDSNRNDNDGGDDGFRNVKFSGISCSVLSCLGGGSSVFVVLQSSSIT